MNHLHAPFTLREGDALRVRSDVPSRIMLMDFRNYRLYRRGDDFEYYGSPRQRSRARIVPPKSGRWHLVVEPSVPGDREATIEIVDV